MGQRGTVEYRDFGEMVPVLSSSLLAWWEVHGRKDPAFKPWMFTPEGKWSEPYEHLNPYPIHVAEVMLHPPAVSAGSA